MEGARFTLLPKRPVPSEPPSFVFPPVHSLHLPSASISPLVYAHGSSFAGSLPRTHTFSAPLQGPTCVCGQLSLTPNTRLSS